MSLQVDESGRRGRSRSPSGRRRDDYNDDYDPRDRSRSRGPPPAKVVDAVPGAFPDDDDRRGASSYGYERGADYRHASPTRDHYAPPPQRSSKISDDEDVHVRYAAGPSSNARREKEYRYEKQRRSSPSDRERDSDRDSDRRRRQRDSSNNGGIRADQMAFLPQKYAQKMVDSGAGDAQSPRSSRGSPRDRDRDRESDRERKERRRREDEDALAYGKYAPRPESPSAGGYSYSQPKQWEYAKPETKQASYPRDDATKVYTSSSSLDPRGSVNRAPSPSRAPSPGPGYNSSSRDKERERESSKYTRPAYGDPRTSSNSVVTVEPGLAPRKSAMKRDRSPQPPTGRMSMLTVQTTHLPATSLAAAPGSPLLESYHGTYQSMSPMPSPLLLPTGGGHGGFHGADLMEALSPIGSEDERGEKRRSRRARFHDPVDDAARIAKALKGEKRAPETEPLIEILPGLTHEQVMQLRVEYKRLVKTGSDRKGVNVAKHVRARLKDEDPNLMKACYAVALGQWESEAYWANFWYQGDKTRRELLIESLMGRSNDEIRAVKDGFSDKKYDNSLTKCMRTELKEDKFKKAVLMVLDEQRMEEFDAHGHPVRLDRELVRDDAKQLHHAVRSEKGGESLMISIVVSRSDSHLREVLQVYSEHYQKNFAREALKRSGNLVGELLAHILNGVINKPVRDALLLHHALTASKKDELRRELLTSRLVRYHWDRHHMAAIKAAYRERYGRDLQEAVKEATSGEWGMFCSELCISRMPDDVRRVERINMIR